MTTTKRRPTSTRVFLDWLARQPAFADDRGGANGKLHAAAVYAGVYNGGTSGLSSLLKSLEADELVKRDVRGKRTYLIAYTGPPVIDDEPEAPVDTFDDSTLDATRERLANAVDPIDWQRTVEPPNPVEATVLPDADVPKLVGRVRLELDLDPTMARLVLDFVERGDGVRPIDRAQARLLIAESVNRATERTAEGNTRIMDRIDQLESDLAAVSYSLRMVTSNSNGTRVVPPRAQRPNFKKLGVSRDSELRKLMEEMAADGWDLSKNGSGHIRAWKPGFEPVVLPCTPSDHRSVLNARSNARNSGAAV